MKKVFVEAEVEVVDLSAIDDVLASSPVVNADAKDLGEPPAGENWDEDGLW